MALSGVSIAFDASGTEGSFAASPTWTSVDSFVESWTIQRGRNDEFGTMQTGTATIVLRDLNGTFDPTNTFGPHYGHLDPDLQIKIELTNPVTAAVKSLFRGFIETLEIDVDVSERLSVVTITAVDLMDRLANTEFVADLSLFGNTTAYTGAGTIDGASASLEYAAAQVDHRIKALLLDAGWVDGNWTIYSGNVSVQATTYSTSDTTLQAIQDAANAEFPGVSVFFIDKLGQPRFYGRLARFNATNPTYSAINSWKCGDMATSASDPSHIALMSSLHFSRDKNYVYNQVTAYPNGITGTDIPAQTVRDTGSVTARGIRALSFENLITNAGDETGTPDANTETLKYATYYKTNYAGPGTRISQVTFKPSGTSGSRATALWKVATEIELSDVLNVASQHPGGGGFGGVDFFVEGLSYEGHPMNSSHPEVTLTVDLSPASYFPTGGSI